MPVYRQISERVRSLVLQGLMQPGTRLPAVRKLARTLGVATATVQRAYAELHSSGLIESKAGSGTVVTQSVGRSTGTAILATLDEVGPISMYERLSDSIGLRSLATGVPDPDLFHADELIAELTDLRNASPWIWYYGPPAGAPQLQRQIVAMLQSRGVEASDEQVIVTPGSTGALSLLLDVVAPPGSTVLVEQPGFLTGNELFDIKKVRGVGIPSGASGIDMAAFRETARLHPGSMLIVFPTFHPATGATLARENRAELLEISRAHGLTVVEVDRYRDLAFEAPPPPLAATNPDVIYVDSFSYSLVPGLRIGYIKAPYRIAEELTAHTKAASMHGSLPMQIALAEYLRKGKLSAHLKRCVPEYKSRRNALLHALELHLPRGTHWTVPGGGFATWITLPNGGGDYEGLYEECLEAGVAFTPSSLLLMQPEPSQLRLAYGRQDPATLRGAVETLGRLVHRRIS